MKQVSIFMTFENKMKKTKLNKTTENGIHSTNQSLAGGKNSSRGFRSRGKK
jgi:hypothetical protein